MLLFIWQNMFPLCINKMFFIIQIIFISVIYIVIIYSMLFSSPNIFVCNSIFSTFFFRNAFIT